jgi:hypothetical protein
MSRLERMKLMIERKKNQKRIEKVLEEKKEAEEKQNKEALEKEIKSKEIPKEDKEEVLKENVIKLDEEDELVEDEAEEGEDMEVDDEGEDVEEEGEDVEEEGEDEELEEGEDEELEADEYYKDYHIYNSEGEEEEEEDDGDYDFEDDEEMFGPDGVYSKDEEMDPRMLSFFVDCDEEELKELSEEDRKIVEAYKNSQKNLQLLRASKKQILKNKQLQLQNKNTPSNGKKVGFNLNEQKSNPAANSKTTPDKNKDAEQINNLSSASKRKSSVNSNGSNNNSSVKRKKRVCFKINHNQFNGSLIINSNFIYFSYFPYFLEYDMLKPITLISNRKIQDIKKHKPVKGSLKIRNKNKK